MNWTTFRTDVRALIGDPPGGIYADADIDAAGRSAYYRAMSPHPQVIRLTVAVAAGATAVTLPQAVESIQSVHTGTRPVEPGTPADMAHPEETSARLMYLESGPTTLQLSRATNSAEAGTWAILATRIPALPTDVSTVWESPTALDGAIIRYAAADLVRTRITTATRRGHKPDYTQNQLANALEREADAITKGYNRTARLT